jgi:hypothetical protein
MVMRVFCRFTVVGLTLLCGLLLKEPSARAAASIDTTVVSHGLRVSLLMDRAVYPWHALVRATIRVENLSGYRAIVSTGPSCPYVMPTVSVWNRQNREVALGGVVSVIPCLPVTGGTGLGVGALRSLHLTPGTTREWTRYMVLGGSRVSAGVSASLISGNSQVWGGSIQTPRAHVQFTQGRRPVVHPCSATEICATISPAPGTHPAGPMFYASTSGIIAADGSIAHACVQYRFPRLASSRTITPGCSYVNLWHFMAGWLNHRVVEVTWKQH